VPIRVSPHDRETDEPLVCTDEWRDGATRARGIDAIMVRTPASLGALLVLAGCGATAPFRPSTPSLDVAPAAPLGASYVLLPRSNDDRSLLGRVLADAPDNGRPLDEVARPNDCADKLGPPKEEPVVSTFEDAQGLAVGGKARAALGPFSFDEDAPTATHFYYKLDVEKRVSVAVTPEYTACCKDKGTCGYGVVTALGYGQGEFAVLAEENVGASVQVPASVEERGFIRARFLHKRYVYGYVAALVTVSDPATAKPVSLLGDPAVRAVDPAEADLSDSARARYDEQKIKVAPGGGSVADFAYTFKDGRHDITENEFVRRYQALTGALDLSAAERNRNPWWLYYGFVAGGVGAFLLGSGAYLSFATPQKTEYFGTTPPTVGSVSSTCDFTTLKNLVDTGWEMQCSPPLDPGLGKTMAITGGVMMGTALASFVVYGVLGYDGSAGDHVIAKSDADDYVARYNRALLRAAVRGAPVPVLAPTPSRGPMPDQNSAPQMRLLPVLSPGFTGLMGRF
jgi:hypothetical protein